MAKLLNIGFGNVVNMDKVVAVVSPDAAPIKRLVQAAKESGRAVDATQGRKTKAGNRRRYAGPVCTAAGNHSETVWSFYRK